MNKKVIAIVVLAIIALVFDYLYAFGPLKQARVNRSVNPQSAKPVKEAIKLNNQPVSLNTYHNKDAAENFYSIKTPADWQLGKVSGPGSYDFTASIIVARVETMDVPDNTTLELYVLSQEEPRIKKEASGYVRTDYQKISINGSQAYQLTYETIDNGVANTTIKTYITGQDKAGVVTVSVPKEQFISQLPALNQFINSFVWENNS